MNGDDKTPAYASPGRCWSARRCGDRYEAFRDLDEARACGDALAILESGDLDLVATCPVRLIKADGTALIRLFRDLMAVLREGPPDRESADEAGRILYEAPPDAFRPFAPEDWSPDRLWLSFEVEKLGLAGAVKAVICGESPRLDPAVVDRITRERLLFSAVERGDVEAARSLLDGGVDVDARREGHLWTALDAAVSRGSPAMAQLLLDRGADPNLRRHGAATPVTSAAVRANPSHGEPDRRPLELLLAAGGRIGLPEAVILGDVDAARRLCDEDPALDVSGLVRLVDDATTYLMLAARYGHLPMIRFLLDRGADVGAFDDEYGRDALTMAAQEGHVEVVALLLDRGADIDRELSCATALSVAAEHGRWDVARLLIDRGARRGVLDAVLMRDAPLVSALLSGPDAARIVESFAMVMAQEEAARLGDFEILERLLDTKCIAQGAWLHRPELLHGPQMLLSIAVQQGWLDVVKFLVARGVNMDGVWKRDMFVASAEAAGHADVVEYLRSLG